MQCIFSFLFFKWSWELKSPGNFPQCHLRLVANEQVVVHGVRDIVDVELQVLPLRHVDEAHARPGGAAIQRVGPGHQRHPLQGRKT